MAHSIISRLTKAFVTSDEQLMGRVQSGDDVHAFGCLVERWQEPIRRLGYRMTGDASLGEDITQEVFLNLFAYRRKYQAKDRFSAFLWRIAVNRCHDERRRITRRRELAYADPGDEHSASVEYLPSEEPLPDARLEQNEAVETVRQALLQLPEHYRTVVVLRHYESLRFQEIAEVLEIPVGTVKSRMAEALSRLHHILGPKLGNAVATESSIPRY